MSICPVLKDADMLTKEETEGMEECDHKDNVTCYLLSQRLPDSIVLQIDACPTMRVCWERLQKDYSKGSWHEQGKQGKKKQLTMEGQQEKAMTTKPESGRRR